MPRHNATVTCSRCGRRLSRAGAVPTRVGTLCRQHADRLPPHLRRPAKEGKRP